MSFCFCNLFSSSTFSSFVYFNFLLSSSSWPYRSALSLVESSSFCSSVPVFARVSLNRSSISVIFSSWVSLVASNSDSVFLVRDNSSLSFVFSSISLCWISSFSALFFSSSWTFLWMTSFSLSLASSFCLRASRLSRSYCNSWQMSLFIFSSSSLLSSSASCLESKSPTFLSILVSFSFNSLFSVSVLSTFSRAFANLCWSTCSFDSPLSLAISKSEIVSSAARSFFSKPAIFSWQESKDVWAFSNPFSALWQSFSNLRQSFCDCSNCASSFVILSLASRKFSCICEFLSSPLSNAVSKSVMLSCAADNCCSRAFASSWDSSSNFSISCWVFDASSKLTLKCSFSLRILLFSFSKSSSLSTSSSTFFSCSEMVLLPSLFSNSKANIFSSFSATVCSRSLWLCVNLAFSCDTV